ncbi:MAG: Glucose-1-phosphate adenylyltransferase [Elusimicrobia bacterium]|nr:Glucose-1-phosphate adenylyltransferase [Elusimicrobiota bacterium]
MKAIVLIGGFGTRLRPLTLFKPKAVLPVLNRPFLSYQFDLLHQARITDVMLACGQKTKPWKNILKGLAPKGLNIHFAFEEKPLGTAGAIRYAFEEFRKSTKGDRSPTLVFNGDVFFDLSVNDFLQTHLKKKANVTIALTRVEDPSRFGLIEMDKRGRILRFLEKSNPPFKTNFINAGAYIFDRESIESIPENQTVSVERETFPLLIKQKKVLAGYLLQGYWNDIGTHESFLNAHRDLLLSKNRWTQVLFLRKRGRLDSTPIIRGQFHYGYRLRLGKGVSIEGFASFGNKVNVGDGSRITNSVIMDNCHIKEGVVMNGAILGKGCHIGAHSVLGEGTVLADKTVIHPYTRC